MEQRDGSKVKTHLPRICIAFAHICIGFGCICCFGGGGCHAFLCRNAQAQNGPSATIIILLRFLLQRGQAGRGRAWTF